MLWLRNAWHGEVKLWKVFWLLSGLAPLSVYYLLFALPLQLYGNVIVTLSHFLAAWALFNIWLVVPLWRCAANTSWRVWTQLARINVLILVGHILYFIGAGGFDDLSGQQRAVELCRHIQLDQAKDKHLDVQQYVTTHATEELRCRESITSWLR
jgi:hypothetical protein